jgi:hypothetical protein
MVSSLGTHPAHENLLVSGGVDGMVYLWDVRAVGASVSVSVMTQFLIFIID